MFAPFLSYCVMLQSATTKQIWQNILFSPEMEEINPLAAMTQQLTVAYHFIAKVITAVDTSNFNILLQDKSERSKILKLSLRKSHRNMCSSERVT